MPCVVGIDFDSRAVHLVRLDENEPRAEYTRVLLEGKTAWDRCFSVSQLSRGWLWDDVYLVGIEAPMGYRAHALYRVQGAILGALPRQLEVWEVRLHEWKGALGIKPNQKPTSVDLTRAAGGPFDTYSPYGWPQDALDALGIALYARDLNAKAIETQLAQ